MVSKDEKQKTNKQTNKQTPQQTNKQTNKQNKTNKTKQTKQKQKQNKKGDPLPLPPAMPLGSLTKLLVRLFLFLSFAFLLTGALRIGDPNSSC